MLIIAIIGVVAIVSGWPRLRGTTLVAPALWAMAAILATAAVSETISPKVVPAWYLGALYSAAVLSLCPTIAVFGAKRPQSGPWQLIVASFALIMCWPIFRWWMFGGGSAIEIHGAHRWFLVILWLTVSANYLPTRFAAASLIISFSQVILISGFGFAPLSATIGFVLAALLVAIGFPRRKPAAEPLDRLWLDYRDAYGAVWGLRIQQRINQSAEMYDWPLRLDWQGFRFTGDEPLSPETRKLVFDNFSNLLRRFVSPTWIAARVAMPVN